MRNGVAVSEQGETKGTR